MSIEITFLVPEVAKAELLITPNRIYYCFATTDTREDSEMPLTANSYNSLLDEILNILKQDDTDNKCEGMRFNIKITNTQLKESTITGSDLSNSKIRQIINLLTPLADEFAFLKGFR